MLLLKYFVECFLNEYLIEKMLFYIYWLVFFYLEKV